MLAVISQALACERWADLNWLTQRLLAASLATGSPTKQSKFTHPAQRAYAYIWCGQPFAAGRLVVCLKRFPLGVHGLEVWPQPA